jgi:hypothetical protein
VAKVMADMKELRYALSCYGRYRPEIVPFEQADYGAPLTGEDKRRFDVAVEYCRERFLHLPVDYLLST